MKNNYCKDSREDLFLLYLLNITENLNWTINRESRYTKNEKQYINDSLHEFQSKQIKDEKNRLSNVVDYYDYWHLPPIKIEL